MRRQARFEQAKRTAVIFLDDNEDDEEQLCPRPSRWHGDDDGACPSHAPGDHDDDRGDDDYILFYSQLGM